MSYITSYRVPEKNDYYYDDSPNPIEEICKYTDNLENIPSEIRYRMLTAICRQKSSSVYGDYAAPPNKQIVDQINGQGGYFLKMTAEAAGIYLIWYQQAKGRYMFWGPTERSVRDGMNRLRGRIVKYVVHLDEQAKEKRVAYGRAAYGKVVYGRAAYEMAENRNANRMADERGDYEMDETKLEAYKSAEQIYSHKRVEEIYAEESASEMDAEEMEYVAPVPPTIVEQFGKASQEQMDKMGFISGKGLGLNHTGRTDPINAIKDIGGRVSNRRVGLGYIKPKPKVLEPEPEPEPVSNALDPVSEAPVTEVL